MNREQQKVYDNMKALLDNLKFTKVIEDGSIKWEPELGIITINVKVGPTNWDGKINVNIDTIQA